MKFKVGDQILPYQVRDNIDRVVIGYASTGYVVYEFKEYGQVKITSAADSNFKLKPQKKEGWIVIAPQENSIGGRSSTMVYPTRKLAESFLTGITVKIEWEE